jgi:uncharacterized protein (TIGR03790 family)
MMLSKLKVKWVTGLLLLAPLFVRAGGDEVVVVYNSWLPASKAVAEHYAAARHVPALQVMGFGLTTNEVISRKDFTELLQKPLVDRLEAARLWKFGEVPVPDTNGLQGLTETRLVQSKIRYAVLCYGVPLKIAQTSKLDELEAKLVGVEFRHNEASVDSELAWLPRIKEQIPLTGPLQNSFYTCTNPATMNCTNGLLMVTRLDGPTPEIASSLVDKAMEAESNGFWGRAYFDARGLKTNDNYYLGDSWMMMGAEICRRLGFETELDTNAATFPASFPMSHIAIYAGWYEGNVSGPFTAPKMEFMPGAFAYHLYSFSADTVRSATRNWCGPLLAKGATCTMGCVYEPYLQFTPNIAFFLSGFGSGYTFGEAAWAAQPALSWQTTVIGDPLYEPFKKTPPELHGLLAREKNPLIEWSFDRLVCLDLARGVRWPQVTQFLENLPTTSHSAVLTEKLASLYDDAGKPISAIETWQKALKLNPSPQQRLRIRLTLGKEMTEQGDDAGAAENYRQLLKEMPDYPGKSAIEEKLKALEPKTADTNAPAK